MIKEKRLGRYLAYASGEILLVVVGILIAIQIDSWNQTRIENAELDGYLRSIAGNIRTDLEKLDNQRQQQERIYASVKRMTQAIENKDTYDGEDFALFARVLYLTWRRQAFSVDTSGYESLKNSGYLSKLLGNDMEKLLFDYYDSSSGINVNGIFDQEDFLSKMMFEFAAIDWKIDPSQMYSSQPVTNQKTIDDLQAHYKIMFSHPVTTSILSSHSFVTPNVLTKWYRQSVMASYFIEMVESGDRSFTDEMRLTIDALNVDVSDVGDPDVYVDGELASFFDIGVASSGRESNWLSADDGQLNIDYPAGQSWGSVFVFVSTTDLKEKPTKDYSTYRKVVLELKGAEGNEGLEFGMKDSADADDGSERTVELTLDSEWQQYEFDLSSFSTADLSDLYIVALFTFKGEQPASISVRNIQFAD